jgi:predicted PurR-regulated permease PerM
MPLKWVAILAAAVAVAVGVTVNVLVSVLTSREVPNVVNMAIIATAAVGTVLAVLADLHERINTRITALTEFLINRLNEIDARATDCANGFGEGHRLDHNLDESVVHLDARNRNRRAINGGDD